MIRETDTGLCSVDQVSDDTEAYSIAQIVRKAGVSRPTVERWIAAGDLEVQYYPGAGTRPIRRVKQQTWKNFEQKNNKNHESRSTGDGSITHYKGITIRE